MATQTDREYSPSLPCMTCFRFAVEAASPDKEFVKPKCVFDGGVERCNACSTTSSACNPCATLMKADFRSVLNNLPKVRVICTELQQYPEAVARVRKVTNTYLREFMLAESEHRRLFNPWGTGLGEVAHRQAYQQMVISMRLLMSSKKIPSFPELFLHPGDPLFIRLRASQKAFECEVNAAINEVLAKLELESDRYNSNREKIYSIQKLRFPPFAMYQD